MAADRFRAVEGDGGPAVLVVVYGNRAFEDALLELYDLAIELGYIAVAGAAFIGEHSYSSPSTPIANGRPDAEDLSLARTFGARVREKLKSAADLAGLPAPQIPGDRPYRSGWEPSTSAATTHPQLCTLCGCCAEVCPVAAITIDSVVRTDVWACIPCNACIRVCPTGARDVDDRHIQRIAQWLSTNFAERKSPETYL
ncbi:MAG: 4Fe-4S binding protein [Anaerolineae bacterium]